MASSHTSVYNVGELDIAQFSMLLFESAHALQWRMRATGERSFDIYIPRSRWKPGGIIVVTVEGHEATLLSKNSETHLGGSAKNANNLQSFIAELDKQRSIYPPEMLTQKFFKAVAEQDAYEKDLAERMQANKLTGTEKMRYGVGGKKVTYALVAINVFVFIMMVISGAGFVTFSSESLIKWGGNMGVLTVNGDWFRLITNVFQHGGIIHLLFNMYALFSVGIYLEPLLGKWRYLTVYLACGILASLASIWWSTAHLSIGASGAIFGLYGVFVALLTTNHIEKGVRNSMLQGIVVFILFNLVYGGTAAGIDNAAHVGGLISGLVFGYLYYFLFLSKKDNVAASMIMTAVLTIGITAAVLPRLKNDDTIKFQSSVQRFAAQEDIALKPLTNIKDSGFSSETANQLAKISLPIWINLKASMDSASHFKLANSYEQQRLALSKYAALRLEQTQLFIKREKEQTSQYDSSLLNISKEISEIRF